MALYFPSFAVKILRNFCVIIVAKDKHSLVPLITVPIGRKTPLANVAIEISSVITVDVIRPVSTALVIVLNRFIFLAKLSRTSVLSIK